MAPDPARQVTKLAEGIARIAKSGSIALVWRDDETGRAHHHALIAALAARQIKLAADIPVAPEQVDFSTSVIRARSAASAALVADLDEEQAARLVRELRRQAYDKPIIGGGAFLRPGVIEAAGDAARDLHALVGFSADSPAPTVRDVLTKYERAHGSRADPHGLVGYAALYLVKAVSERAGTLDAEAFAVAMRGVRLLARDAPGVLLDVAFDGRGTPDYELLIVAIRDGKPVVIDSLPPG
jgi:branched-chain amino acid transport system substrate-binding protein